METAPWSERGKWVCVLVGLELVVAGVVGFFLLSGLGAGFLGLFCRVGFGAVGLEGFWLEVFDVEGLGVGGFVGLASVLSGAVTVSVLVLRGGEVKPSWAVTGITVRSSGVGMVPWFGFIVWD